MKLLFNGKEAFPEILRCIDEARESIYINMFIWRNDSIGRDIARAVLDAANRGVDVTISKDRYGCICELCEENRQSFFHHDISAGERIKIKALEYIYNRDLLKEKREDIEDPLLGMLRAHPGVHILDEVNKYDHSKYYIFDRKILIFGGINIEDKELYEDRKGREYSDYMVKLTGEEYVKEFLGRSLGKMQGSRSIFRMNVKKPVRIFELEDAFLELIKRAEKELTIVMAYFSPLPEFMDDIKEAAGRGVRIKLVIPSLANFTDDTNKRTVRKLMKLCGGNISVWLSPKMLHAKLLMSEKEIILGSCNITKKAFHQLDELDLCIEREGSGLEEQVEESVRKIIEESARVDGDSPPPYSRMLAAFEGILM